MNTAHLFLVGFMGAGKSTVACEVAERTGRVCVDLDREIEDEAQSTVSEIFSAGGELAFRDLESAALERMAERPAAVVACGGGVVLRPENRALLRAMGRVVYLAVTAEEAIARVGDCSTRPLLAGSGGTLAATALLSAREGLYRSVADVVVDTVGKTSAQVADEVIAGVGL